MKAKLGRYQEATEDYDKALKIESYHEKVLLNMTSAKLYLWQFREAFGYYVKSQNAKVSFLIGALVFFGILISTITHRNNPSLAENNNPTKKPSN